MAAVTASGMTSASTSNVLDSFAYFLPLACFVHCTRRRQRRRPTESNDMDPKLTMLFLLIAAIIGLSHLSKEFLARVKGQFAIRRWRELVPARRKS
ncbi:MAG: hypothetical protein JO205_04825 [Pseudolabrys sp.]|nr:hypothetical protein [Pseudolabrys sp.]